MERPTRSAPISLFLSLVKTGFPSPADDFLEDSLNLHDLIVMHPAATFFVRASGDSMRDAGITPGDILVVDRAVTVQSGMIVLARINDEFTVKKFVKQKSGITLQPANPRYLPIKITPEMDFEVWGVVIAVVHLLTYRRL